MIFWKKSTKPQRMFVGKIAILSTICAILLFVDDTFAYTDKEKDAIVKLRSAMGEKLKHDFMKTDEYIMRWLLAKNMDLKSAEDMLGNSLKWRKDNNIDKIVDEDFALYEKQYPIQMDGVDKEGRPVVTLHFGKWVPRKAAVNGQIDHLVRYMIRNIMELPRIKAEGLSKESGKQNSKFLMLTDMSGYNLKEHACLQCFGLYTKFVQLYENNYPEAVFKSIVVNAPTIFETILELIKPIMSPASKRDFSVHGIRKAEWKNDILKLIDADQITTQYGGSKKQAAG